MTDELKFNILININGSWIQELISKCINMEEKNLLIM